MVNVSTEVTWDQHALEMYFVAIEDALLPDLAAEVADVARAIAPVRTRRTGPMRHRGDRHPGLPGRLKASVQWDVGRDYAGAYADIAALWYGRFLDPPARQLKRLYPFLPSALYMVIDGKEYYL